MTEKWSGKMCAKPSFYLSVLRTCHCPRANGSTKRVRIGEWWAPKGGHVQNRKSSTYNRRAAPRSSDRENVYFSIFLVFARGHVLLLVGKWRFSPHSKHVKNGHFTQNLNEKPVFLGKLWFWCMAKRIGFTEVGPRVQNFENEYWTIAGPLVPLACRHRSARFLRDPP